METGRKQGGQVTSDRILSMVADRPYSVKQISHSFSARSYDVMKLLSEMVRNGQIMVKSTNEGLFVVGAHPNL